MLEDKSIMCSYTKLLNAGTGLFQFELHITVDLKTCDTKEIKIKKIIKKKNKNT